MTTEPQLTAPTPKKPSSVKELLDSFDEMRRSGADEEAQFEFLRKHFPVKPEVPEPAKDVMGFELRLEEQERIKAIYANVKEAVANVRKVWDESTDLPDEVRMAGQRLLKTLDQIRGDAEAKARKSWKTEVEMLSELWVSDPDVSAYFEAKEVSLRPKAAPSAEQLPIELPSQSGASDCLPPTSSPAPLSDGKKAVVPARQRFMVRTGAADLDLGRIVSSVQETPGLEPIPEDESNALVRQAWVEALREMTTVPWVFEREAPKGVMSFKADNNIAVLSACGDTMVSLSIRIDDQRWHHTQFMDADEQETLHLNPMPFVKSALETKPSTVYGTR